MAHEIAIVWISNYYAIIIVINHETCVPVLESTFLQFLLTIFPFLYVFTRPFH